VKRVAFSRPYIVSTAIHLVLLVLLALWTVSTENQQRWYRFDWLSEADLGTVDGAARAGDPAASPSTEQSLGPEADAPVLEAPQIEQPVWENTDIRNSIADPVAVKDKLASSLREAGSTQGIPSGSYSSNLLEGGGDAFFIRETAPQITPLMDDSVVVEFSLNRNGTVAMNSLKVISYRKAEHWRALREAMRGWRFGFTGAYVPGNIYRISCNFKLR
jgi:hypothetical protein